jgi:hypothetical protein
MTDDLKDFEGFIKDRARKKRTEPEEVPAALTEEANMFNASVGLRIKCGVCGTMHKSSRVDLLPALAACITKIVDDQRRNYRYESRSALEWTSRDHETGVPTALRMTYKITNAVTALIPKNPVWSATHAKFMEKVTERIGRIDDMYERGMVESVPVSDILGAPNSFQYVKDAVKRFDGRATAEQETSNRNQIEDAGDLGKDLMRWRELAVEGWKIDRKVPLSKYTEKYGIAVPIGSVAINGQQIDSMRLLGSFRTISTDRMIWDARNKSQMSYVLDVDLWKGTPALLWTVRAQQGYKESRRRRRYNSGTTHGAPIIGMTFLSLWTEKVYIVHGTPATVAGAIDFDRHEIVTKKTDSEE